MGNHYHLLLRTPQPNLSRGMRQVNGVYTQCFNRRHEHVGHVFQGRFGGVLVERESYLLELARYVPLNPVRAGFVSSAGQWPWSSYRATAGLEAPPPRLTTRAVLEHFAPTRESAAALGGRGTVQLFSATTKAGVDQAQKTLEAWLKPSPGGSPIPAAQ